jgi:hypothetical protein
MLMRMNNYNVIKKKKREKWLLLPCAGSGNREKTLEPRALQLLALLALCLPSNSSSAGIAL